ncbi:hypothetical protein FN846DRAFT_894960 [Sphaerosporella brunnea]|uniref:Uncharacterized protein n=1 Tax=Sphaerosporella brunnea TaxID=1250544 RepID=A0A5J5EGQ7_9PEZI|nr:hypothetical protein FN846DRAFT_894960 [Sphaerosporella brunnea]
MPSANLSTFRGLELRGIRAFVTMQCTSSHVSNWEQEEAGRYLLGAGLAKCLQCDDREWLELLAVFKIRKGILSMLVVEDDKFEDALRYTFLVNSLEHGAPDFKKPGDCVGSAVHIREGSMGRADGRMRCEHITGSKWFSGFWRISNPYVIFPPRDIPLASCQLLTCGESLARWAGVQFQKHYFKEEFWRNLELGSRSYEARRELLYLLSP